jgi:hypothetical protein
MTERSQGANLTVYLLSDIAPRERKRRLIAEAPAR